jgi:hypothetical protein
MFTLVAFLFTSVTQAQFFSENLDTFSAGVPVGTQSPLFLAWGGDPTVDPRVSDLFSTTAPNSLRITSEGGVDDDTIMDLGNVLGGQYTLQFSMYLPAGAVAFYGLMQTNDSANPVFTTTIYPNNGGTGEDVIAQDGAIVASGTFFPTDQWMSITHFIDLDLDTIQILVDGQEIYNGIYFGNGSFALGGVDLWCPDSGTCDVYLDDFLYAEDFLSTESFQSTEFVAYPNPVQNELNLTAKELITSVAVYNVLGQEIYVAEANALSTTIDTSSFASGAYFVKVIVGGIEGVVKVLK